MEVHKKVLLICPAFPVVTRSRKGCIFKNFFLINDRTFNFFFKNSTHHLNGKICILLFLCWYISNVSFRCLFFAIVMFWLKCQPEQFFNIFIWICVFYIKRMFVFFLSFFLHCLPLFNCNFIKVSIETLSN